MMKKVGFYIGILMTLWSLVGFAVELKTGDLVFVGAGAGNFSSAISESTASTDSIKLVHVGIVEVEGNGKVNVIEASPEEGVRSVSLEKFIEEVPRIGEKPQVWFKRVGIDFPVEDCISRAKAYMGQPYDWWYLPDNGKMYCSELVYESYLDEKGNHIFEAQSMNFRSPDGSMPQFWIELFEELGQTVPEGVLGTNPSDLSKSPVLQSID